MTIKFGHSGSFGMMVNGKYSLIYSTDIFESGALIALGVDAVMCYH